MGDRQRRLPVAHTRRLGADRVPEERDHPRLVVRDPTLDDIAQGVRHQRRVLGEALGGLAHRPAAGELPRLRQVPVIERRDGLDPPLEQVLHEPPVEGHALHVQRAATVRLHARPGDRDAVALEPERGHQVEVLGPAVVVVARDVAGVAVQHGTRDRAEAVPDRLATPVLARGALDLVRSRRRAEAEVRPERAVADRRRCGGRRHPFTAPAVMPLMSQRCVTKKAMRTGRVETTPAAISCAVLSW